MTIIDTDCPDYRSLVEREAPLGFARHFALCEWLGPRFSLNSARDTLVSPPLPPLPAFPLGVFTRGDNLFRWSDGAVAQGLRQLGESKGGFAVLASEGFDADALSPFELGAACSALMAPPAAFVPLVTSSGFCLSLVSEAPIDLGQLSLGSTMATLREASRYCLAPKEEWVPGLLQALGFSLEPTEQGVVCRRGGEHFLGSFRGERPQLIYGQSLARLCGTVAPPSLASLLEQAVAHLDGSQDFEVAHQALLAAVDLDPQSYDAQLQLGRVEMAQGRLEPAELRLLLASLLRPGEGEALAVLADCYALADKIPQAIAVQEQLLDLDPGNVGARESLERLKNAL